MPKVSLKLMAGPPVRREEWLLRPRFPTAAETAARWCALGVQGRSWGRTVRGHTGCVPPLSSRERHISLGITPE